MNPSLPPDAGMASSLLSIIGDPTAAKKRLEELTSLQKQAEDAMDAAREAAKAADAKLAKADDAHSNLKAIQADLDAQKEDLAKKQQDLATKIEAYSQNSSRIALEGQAMVKQQKVLSDSLLEITSQRASLGVLEASLVERSKSMAEQEAVLKAKMEQFKMLMSS